ncbi:histidine phosphatase family protein [Frigidibacter sp. MR17.14]|uniref:histidine phosphatase family protein n=1 Tax=Frigidibacter sp. MR17.14 TaxID=3126509 RepID=UPI00301301E1
MILLPRPFCLIRHGQTDANRDRIIAGRTEAQLTEAGRVAARALATRPWPEALALFASPQQRALETARLGFPGRAPEPVAGLRERDWGIFEGRPTALQPPRLTVPEEGESWEAVVDRVAAAIRHCQELAGEALPVMVAHSGTIRAARQLTGGSCEGPSPVNAVPTLFLPLPEDGGWRETGLAELARGG